MLLTYEIHTLCCFYDCCIYFVGQQYQFVALLVLGHFYIPEWLSYHLLLQLYVNYQKID